MSRTTELQRLEFINALQRNYASILARNELQGNELVSVVFGDSYDLQNPRDIGMLLSSLDDVIDNQLQPEMYDYVVSGINSLTEMGNNHAVSRTLNVMGDAAFDFLDISDRLALDYITRMGVDGKRLTDRIWDATAKEAITKEVYNSIRNGDSAFKLAENIQKVVAEGTPMHKARMIADTELTYAYSHAKADTVLQQSALFPNAQAYVKIGLSPAHPKADICDVMVGTYRAEEAPLPPYHPNCICEMDTFLETKDRVRGLTDLMSNFGKFQNASWFNGGIIETATETIVLPDPFSAAKTGELLFSDLSRPIGVQGTPANPIPGTSYQDVAQRWGVEASNGRKLSTLADRWNGADTIENNDRKLIGESEWIMHVFPDLDQAGKQRAKTRLQELISLISDRNRNQIEMVLKFL